MKNLSLVSTLDLQFPCKTIPLCRQNLLSQTQVNQYCYTLNQRPAETDLHSVKVTLCIMSSTKTQSHWKKRKKLILCHLLFMPWHKFHLSSVSRSTIIQNTFLPPTYLKPMPTPHTAASPSKHFQPPYPNHLQLTQVQFNLC